MKNIIVQSSFPRSASTLLVNLLYGLIVGMQDQPIVFSDFYRPMYLRGKTMIVKTHDVNLDTIAARFGTKFNLYFVCSERGHARFEEKYRHRPNVAIFDYDQLVADPLTVVNTVADRLDEILDPSIEFSRLSAMRRIEDMNARYEEIKNLPFSYVDPFFNLHGSHRHRPRSALDLVAPPVS